MWGIAASLLLSEEPCSCSLCCFLLLAVLLLCLVRTGHLVAKEATGCFSFLLVCSVGLGLSGLFAFHVGVNARLCCIIVALYVSTT